MLRRWNHRHMASNLVWDILKKNMHTFFQPVIYSCCFYFLNIWCKKKVPHFFCWAQHGFPILPRFSKPEFLEAWEAGYEGYWNDWGASWSEWSGWQSRDRLLLCQCDMSVVRLWGLKIRSFRSQKDDLIHGHDDFHHVHGPVENRTWPTSVAWHGPCLWGLEVFQRLFERLSQRHSFLELCRAQGAELIGSQVPS